MIESILPRLKKVKRSGSGYIACCPAHEDKQASLSVTMGQKGVLLKCHAGCAFGDIADALGLKPSDLFIEPIADSGRESSRNSGRVIEKTEPPPSDVPLKEIAVYQYRNELGLVLYEVVRYEPKTFRQRHEENGKTVWNMQNVRRVPYNLPAVMQSSEVHVVEGEKDADNLNALGYVATTNVGGAVKWLDAYSDFLIDKRVIVWPDNDAAGEKHCEAVIASIAQKARDVRVCRVPAVKDVSDFIAKHGNRAKDEIENMIADSDVLTKGVYVPVYTMKEASDRYARLARRYSEVTFSMSTLLPSLKDIRPLVPGELVVVMADTGHGKSAFLQNVADRAKPMSVLYFSLELPMTMIFERQISVAYGIPGWDTEAAYRNGEEHDTRHVDHVVICEKSRLNPSEIERIINQTELKIDKRPAIVMVDYLGLVQGSGKRYERLSDAAEDLKRIAKDTNTIVFMASQVKRREEDDEVCLHDGKDSGSIENSGGLVIGLWRDNKDVTGKTMKVKVLKCTKGKAGLVITCDFDGPRMRIKERI